MAIHKSPRYTLYVDEAGDDGLKAHSTHRSAAGSEWFVLGGIVVKRSDEPKLVQIMQEASNKAGLPFGRDLHFARLNHKKRGIICHELALGPFRWFAVASHKDNMRSYKNERAAGTSKKINPLYNWLLRLLLERVTRYCKNYNSVCSITNNNDDINVVLSNRGGLRSGEFGDYFTRLWLQFQSGNTYLSKGLIDFSVFNPTNLSIAQNSEVYGLQAADFIVSSLYKSLPQACQPTPSRDYLNILLPRCAALNGKLFNAGIVALPFEWKATLSGEKLEIIRYFEGLAASPRLCDPTTKYV